MPIGTADDAKLYAKWLSAVRAVLNPHGIRLTADVASWSPVLTEYATLAPAVDRLQTMSTYVKLLTPQTLFPLCKLRIMRCCTHFLYFPYHLVVVSLVQPKAMRFVSLATTVLR